MMLNNVSKVEGDTVLNLTSVGEKNLVLEFYIRKVRVREILNVIPLFEHLGIAYHSIPLWTYNIIIKYHSH